ELARELEAPLRFTSLVPAQLARLLQAASDDPSLRAPLQRFDALLIGGQALAAPLHERALEAGLAVVRTYGASETAGGCVYDGRPIGRMTARLADGELELAGPSLAEGYLGDDDLTAARFPTVDGRRWYRTADAGVIDETGLVSVTGRLDNVIISGGVKVSLDRVERLVQAVPGFENAIAVARDSERWGQQSVIVAERGPLAAAVAHDDEALREAALAVVRAVVIRGAGRAAAPADLVEVERLPRLSSGKPDRLAAASGLRAGDR
ncbi:MAG: AMP-binding protein, partial [Herbiconiux sp.]|nr:AMP-binding protein [Herbiconiux sp.]